MLPDRQDGAATSLIRQEREQRRIGRAVAAARRERAPPMAVALAQIGAAFDEAAVIHGFKLRIERVIALGPDHAAVQARYGVRAAMLEGLTLDAAIARVERWWRAERKAFQIARVFGSAPRLSLDVLSELRLMLRLMRRQSLQADFATICAAVARDFASPAAAG